MLEDIKEIHGVGKLGGHATLSGYMFISLQKESGKRTTTRDGFPKV